MLYSIYLVMILCHYPLPMHQLPLYFIKMLTLYPVSPLGFNSFFWTTPPLSLLGLWNPVNLTYTMQMASPSLLGSDGLEWSVVTLVHPLGHPSHPPIPWHPESAHSSVWTSSLVVSGCHSSLSSTIHWGLFPQPHLMQHRFLILKSFAKFSAREILSSHILPLIF